MPNPSKWIKQNDGTAIRIGVYCPKFHTPMVCDATCDVCSLKDQMLITDMVKLYG
jgi:hypothetical protein